MGSPGEPQAHTDDGNGLPLLIFQGLDLRPHGAQFEDRLFYGQQFGLDSFFIFHLDRLVIIVRVLLSGVPLRPYRTFAASWRFFPHRQ